VATGETLEQQLEARDPDVRLMLQVRDDVQGAFEVLVERYQHRLVGIMVHLVGRVEEAEDLTQEVFLRSTGPARGTGLVPSSRPGSSRSPTTWR
jgi:RNA polymerase sigma-70 factor (ECF subfamily)